MSVTNNRNEISLKTLILSIFQWIKFLGRKWLIILLVGLTGGAIGLWYASNKKPIYNASLSFVLEDDATGSMGSLGIASQLGFDIGQSSGGVFKGSNVIELFKSRSMIQKALLSPTSEETKKSLAEKYIEIHEWRKGWEEKKEMKNIAFPVEHNSIENSRVQDSILSKIHQNMLEGGLEISQQDKKTSIITIKVNSIDESFAKDFTEKIAEIVSKFYVDTKSKKARENLNILEHQTDSIKARLSGSIASVAVSTDQTFGLNPALNVKRIPSVKGEIDVQTNKALLSELIKQVELARINLRKETPLIQIIDSPILPLKVTKFGKLKGIVIGGFLSGFLILSFLIARRVFKDIMAD